MKKNKTVLKNIPILILTFMFFSFVYAQEVTPSSVNQQEGVLNLQNKSENTSIENLNTENINIINEKNENDVEVVTKKNPILEDIDKVEKQSESISEKEIKNELKDDDKEKKTKTDDVNSPVTALSALKISPISGGSSKIENFYKAQSPEADMSSGALLYKYKLKIPDGRNGLKPDLQLQYNSQNTKNESVFGFGWDINIPYIERKNLNGVNKLYTRNDFTSSLYGELRNISGNIYGPRVDGGDFTQLNFASSTYWTVKDKKGNLYTYGQSSSARLDNPNDSSKVYRWLLEKVEDVNGNNVTYQYFKNSGQIYPDNIVYTNSTSTTGIYKLIFNRESRSDVLFTYNPQFKVTTSYRINKVDLLINNLLKKSFVLNYTAASTTNKSLLNSIVESANNGISTTTLPAAKFSYGNATSSNFQYDSVNWTTPDDQYLLDYYTVINQPSPKVAGQNQKIHFNTQPNSNYTGPSSILVDVNGDGLLDAVQSQRCLNTGCLPTNGTTSIDKSYIYINNGSGWTYDSSWTTPQDQYEIDFAAMASTTSIKANGQNVKISFNTPQDVNPVSGGVGTQFVDVNGDGLVDAVQSQRCTNDYSCLWPTATSTIDKTYIYINNGSGWTYDPSWTTPQDQYQLDYATLSSTTPLKAYGQNIRVHFNTRMQQSYIGVPSAFTDVNGDGLSDIVQSNICNASTGCSSTYGIDKTYVYINNGNGSWTYDSNWTTPEDKYLIDTFALYPAPSPKIMGQNQKIHFNTQPNSNYTGPSSILVDVNGDGLLDAVQSQRCLNTGCLPTNGTTSIDKSYIYINTGTGWLLDNSWSTPADQFEIDFGIAASTTPVKANGQNVKITFNTPQDTNPISGGTASQFVDVNGDGLLDAVQSQRCINNYNCLPGTATTSIDKSYVYINTGNGWVLDQGWNTPQDEYQLYLAQISSTTPMKANGQNIRIHFNTKAQSSNIDVPASYSDINGDGLPDAIQSNVCNPSTGCNSSYGINKVFVYVNNTSKYLLNNISTPIGGNYSALYKTAQQYITGGNTDNKRPQFAVMTLNSLTENDGNGNIATSTYNYSGGSYYFNNSLDKKFAGFEKVTKTLPDNRKVITYYHQGNSTNSGNSEYSDSVGKIGMVFRTDLLDSSNIVLQRSTSKIETFSLGTDRNFVYPSQTINEHDGVAESTTYNYNTSTGNLTDKIEWGSVSASTPLTFTDSGNDKRTTSYTYLTSTTTNVTVPNNIQIKDQSGNKISEQVVTYDDGTLSKGLATNIASWVSTSTYNNSQKSYNSYGQVLTETDPRGKITTYTYDSPSLFVATITKPLSLVSSYVYDYLTQNPIQITDENSRVFKYTYDGLGRTLTEQIPIDSNPTSQVTQNTYNYFDIATGTTKVSVQKISSDPVTNYYTLYDGLGREIRNITQSTTTSYVAQDSVYDLLGRLVKKSIPYNFSNSTSTYSGILAPTNYLSTNYFDLLDRVGTTTNSIGTTTNVYSGNTVITTDANGKSKSYTKDGLGRLLTVTEKLSGVNYNTNYEWNVLDKLTKITDALGNIRNFIYDGEGKRLLTEDSHANGDATFGVYNYQYDQAGNLISKNTPASSTILYVYDDVNRILSERLSTDPATTTRISYGYDNCTDGKTKLCFVNNSNGIKYTYTYTPNGQIKSEGLVVPGITGTSTTSYTYDTQQNLKDITHPDSSKILYIYSFRNQPQTIQYQATSTPTNVVNNITYNELGLVATTTLANGVNVVNTYDTNKLFRLINKLSQKTGATTTLQNISYNYDNVGNILNLIDSSNSSTTKNVIYYYDDLYRLTNAIATTSSSTLYNTSYTYNILGNLLTKGGTSYTYSNAGLLNPHAPSQVGSSTLSYDNNGNLTNDGTQTNIWDYNNRLASSTVASSTTTYLYNQDGIRIKLSNASTTSYNLNKYFVKFGTSTTTKNIYLGDKLIATIDNNVPSYILTDHLGSTEKVTNTSGTIISQTDYLPYGEVRLQNGKANQRGYIGEITDANNINYLNNRYLNNKQGQFISQDPVFWEVGSTKDGQQVLLNPQAQNSYSYGNGNPIVQKDPSGRISNDGKLDLSMYQTPEAQAAMNPINVGLTVLSIPAETLQALGIVSGISKVVKYFRGAEEVKTEAQTVLQVNKATGAAFEEKTASILSKTEVDIAPQMTLKTQSGVKTRIDFMTKDSFGKICLVECKSSATAPLTANQSKAFPEILKSGATVVGKGKPGFEGGMSIPPTQVQVVRP